MASFKERRIVKLFYNFPGALSAYHFLWAWTGATVYRYPSKKLFVIGVTGTKGKTTTLEIINAILEAGGKRTALLSSLRVKVGERSVKNHTGNSMPGRAFIQKFLRDAVREKCEYALIEVSSQAVVQHRHRFIKWDMGVITNLAPEHIESHGSFENYRAAKLSFLQYVFRQGGEVFLNRDDKEFTFFFNVLAAFSPTAYSKEDEFLKNYLPRIRAASKEERFILSDFNIEHIAVAAAIGEKLGIDDAAIERAILNFEGVPGRMEFVREGGYTGVVDYAHTPDSLEAAYRAVKPNPSAAYPHPRLIALLGGAGGGRDKWKRPAMGAIAARYCDEIILTDEDPYNENPSGILDEIAGGIREADPEKAKRVHNILDRKKAIYKAFELARPGDVVIGTGKGSEEWIHVAGGKKVPWSERGLFEEALRERLGAHAKGADA
ncbi:MAG: UDP-N-acetylmuramyl-tripeptide synthetase [Candidatus Pacebacteria bacterium]|nr:UDP-N-acetylmuramyl-tripeptide synthetase [Candidatus Paceibacterota bacterium]